ncbi:MAG TPA: RraA family protein [Burkholderiales bacterium]|nr:RraA family protein [Burkholderiales bacterium]
MVLRLLLAAIAAILVQPAMAALPPEEIIAALRRPENSTGNIADAVEEATGARGWMSADMKPIMDGKIVGRAWTALLRPVLKSDERKYPNFALQVLDEAPAGSVLVYVLEGGLEIAGMGNLMATTAKVRGLEGTVIDGAVRDVSEIRRIGHPVFARRISPATSVGRLVSVAKQVPVKCAEITVHPGDYIVGDPDGVVVVPQAAAQRVVELLRQYDEKESKMIPIIQREKSMLKALEIYQRY